MAKKGTYGEKLTTPTGRVSYPHLFQKSKGKDGKEGKYEITLLIPKSTDLAPLRAAIDAVGKEEFGTAWTVIAKKKPAIRDGDEWADEKAAEGKDAEEYRGHWFIHPRSSRMVQVVGPDLLALKSSEEIYGGCYARCNVTPGSYDVDGSKGVTLYLNAVQKAKDGERFGASATNAEDVFEAFAEEANEDVGF